MNQQQSELILALTRALRDHEDIYVFPSKKTGDIMITDGFECVTIKRNDIVEVEF